MLEHWHSLVVFAAGWSSSQTLWTRNDRFLLEAVHLATLHVSPVCVWHLFSGSRSNVATTFVCERTAADGLRASAIGADCKELTWSFVRRLLNGWTGLCRCLHGFVARRHVIVSTVQFCTAEEIPSVPYHCSFHDGGCTTVQMFSNKGTKVLCRGT